MTFWKVLISKCMIRMFFNLLFEIFCRMKTKRFISVYSKRRVIPSNLFQKQTQKYLLLLWIGPFSLQTHTGWYFGLLFMQQSEENRCVGAGERTVWVQAVAQRSWHHVFTGTLKTLNVIIYILSCNMLPWCSLHLPVVSVERMVSTQVLEISAAGSVLGIHFKIWDTFLFFFGPSLQLSSAQQRQSE